MLSARRQVVGGDPDAKLLNALLFRAATECGTDIYGTHLPASDRLIAVPRTKNLRTEAATREAAPAVATAVACGGEAAQYI